MIEYTAQDHSFVICAYGENPHLPECIKSLMSQTIKSNVFMATSTPNDYIKSLCDEYGITLFINTGDKGLAQDWNFAYESVSNSRLITIAHQDDIYESDYLSTILNHINRSNRPLIAFTDYYEIRNDVKVLSNKLLRIKRLMNFALRFRIFQGCKFVRRVILSFGSPICCPAVAYVRESLPMPIFDTSFKNDCDYKAWADISKFKGNFIYSSKKLVGHRIYPQSATTANIQDNSRYQEDLLILSSFWPNFIAKAIARVYRSAEKSNDVDE